MIYPTDKYTEFSYYFPEAADNKAVNITCPYRSISYEWWYNQTTSMETTVMHYDMTISNYEDYPYCKLENEPYDRVEWDIQEGTCTLNTDYSSPFGDCVPTYPGFYTQIGDSTATSDYYQTPTKTAIPQNFYTRLTQGNGYDTRNIMKRCPPGTEALFSAGGSEEQVCQIIEDGDCFYSSSHYCQQGTEYFCPIGMKLKGSPDKKSLAGTCEPCATGE